METACAEVSEIRVVDALSLPDLQDRFHFYEAPFAIDAPKLIYQAYDREVASRVKLALLECYPPDFEVTIVGASESGEAIVNRTEIAKLDWPSHHFDHLTSIFVPSLPESKRPMRFAALVDIVARLLSRCAQIFSKRPAKRSMQSRAAMWTTISKNLAISCFRSSFTPKWAGNRMSLRSMMSPVKSPKS
jgi:uncharacterized protein YabN with tetrapyrrole methylase and pyrophosphatase domain